VTLATPPVVVALAALKRPLVVPKVTVVPSATGFPFTSVTVACSVVHVVPSAGMLPGLATSTTVSGTSGVKITLTLSVAMPALASMVAVPEVVEEVSVTWAMPPLVLAVVFVAPPNVPRLVTKVTTVPSGTGLPPESSTSAVIVVVVVPSARMLGGAALSVRLLGPGVGVRCLPRC